MKQLILFLFANFFIGLQYNFAQDNCIDNLGLKVRCLEWKQDHKGDSIEMPVFILEIRNANCPQVIIPQEIWFGHKEDLDFGDLTFELLFVSGTDSINVLKNMRNSSSGWPSKDSNNIILYSNTAYLFEFAFLRSYYFQKKGNYLIRFTLLKSYAPKYMTKNISSEWYSFNINSARN